jgi:hypothetical protein
MPKETPIQTLNYYAHIVSMIMQRPLDNAQRLALVRRVERALPVAALRELRSEWAMTLALTLTSELLANGGLRPSRMRQLAPAARDPS